VNPAALLRFLDPETAHGVGLRALRWGFGGRDHSPDDPALEVSAFKRVLKNPVGLAAGFDKDGVAVEALGRLGFGFVEAGTVTPRAQAGNARPRLFRLEEDRAVINRMGFNNGGIEGFLRNLGGVDRSGVAVGANIGINKEGAEPERDYAMLAERVAPVADYVTINVSSPNTPGLRDLQGEEKLDGILRTVRVDKPVFLKIAPDLAEDALAGIVEICVARGVAGLIISNTTVARPEGLRGRFAAEPGGLSGAPLLERSTKMLAEAYKLARGRLVLVGVGGIFTAEDAFAKILAGASLVQVYTGFAYQGPKMIPALKQGLARLVRARGLKNVSEAVGAGL